MQRQSKGGGFRALMAAVINRAIDDLKDTDPKLRAVEKDRVMGFVLSDDCEAWCLKLEMNYEAVKGKAAALYRRFLEKAAGCEKASRESGAGRPGQWQGRKADRNQYAGYDRR
jgi:hypothetical protein